MRLPALAIALPAVLLAACNGRDAAVEAKPAQPYATARSTTSIDGLVLETSTMAVADLNPEVAARYGIERGQAGILLLVTVRDAQGNGVDPGDLRLEASAGTLTDALQPLALRAVQTDGMTDYIGLLPATPPAHARFRLAAARGGSRAEISTTAELQPR